MSWTTPYQTRENKGTQGAKFDRMRALGWITGTGELRVSDEARNIHHQLPDVFYHENELGHILEFIFHAS
ncbi:hypothetical protein NC652_001054 [Populus alba x Populus x berolinensis]|nr:hypothetical protein NC652_001054 [Populus alba x Populus x berolinensis]